MEVTDGVTRLSQRTFTRAEFGCSWVALQDHRGLSSLSCMPDMAHHIGGASDDRKAAPPSDIAESPLLTSPGNIQFPLPVSSSFVDSPSGAHS